MAICLTNLQHCRNRGCLFALYWLHAKKEMSLFYDLSLLAKLEMPLKWCLWFLEVFEVIRVLETLQYPKWRFASPICNTVEIEVVSLRYIDFTRKRRCLYFMSLWLHAYWKKKGDVSILYWLHAKKEMSLFYNSLAKLEMPLKWYWWFLEVFEVIRVLETLQYPKWRFASPICNTVEIEVVSLRYIDFTRKRRCLYFMTLTPREKEMSLFYNLSLLAKLEMPLKWCLWFLEVFEEIRVLETLQYPKWRFASPICNTVEIEVVSLRYIDSTRKRRCLYFVTLTTREKEMSLFYNLSLLAKLEMPLKWCLWFLEVFEEIRVLETLQYPKWRFASPICNTVEIEVVSLRYIDSTRKRRCLYFVTLTTRD